MLDREKCRNFLAEQKFSEMYRYFENEYKEIFDKILKIKGIDCKSETLVKTMIIASEEIPELFDIIMLINESLFEPGKPNYERLETLMDLYVNVYNVYKKYNS
ncbi:MAG: hypothetical protein RR922_02655 [Clostridia bacterium]